MFSTHSQLPAPPVLTELFYNSFLHTLLEGLHAVICIFCSNLQHVGFCSPPNLSVHFILMKGLCWAFFRLRILSPLSISVLIVCSVPLTSFNIKALLQPCSLPGCIRCLVQDLLEKLVIFGRLCLLLGLLLQAWAAGALAGVTPVWPHICNTGRGWARMPCACWCCALVNIMKERTGCSYLSGGDRWVWSLCKTKGTMVQEGTKLQIFHGNLSGVSLMLHGSMVPSTCQELRFTIYISFFILPYKVAMLLHYVPFSLRSKRALCLPRAEPRSP